MGCSGVCKGITGQFSAILQILTDLGARKINRCIAKCVCQAMNSLASSLALLRVRSARGSKTQLGLKRPVPELTYDEIGAIRVIFFHNACKVKQWSLQPLHPGKSNLQGSERNTSEGRSKCYETHIDLPPNPILFLKVDAGMFRIKPFFPYLRLFLEGLDKLHCITSNVTASE